MQFYLMLIVMSACIRLLEGGRLLIQLCSLQRRPDRSSGCVRASLSSPCAVEADPNGLQWSNFGTLLVPAGARRRRRRRGWQGASVPLGEDGKGSWTLRGAGDAGGAKGSVDGVRGGEYTTAKRHWGDACSRPAPDSAFCFDPASFARLLLCSVALDIPLLSAYLLEITLTWLRRPSRW